MSTSDRRDFGAARRAWLRGLAQAGLALGSRVGASPEPAPELAAADEAPWHTAQEIVDRLAAPLKFRDEDFPITRHGARRCVLVEVDALVGHAERATVRTQAPGAYDCREAIESAIAACHDAGGGRVLIPAGDWYCAGPIVLRSRVHLHLAAGAQILFSTDPHDYARHGDHDCGEQGRLVASRWQGNDCLNFSPLIYARGQQHFALTGEGPSSVLNGQAGVAGPHGVCWWDWKMGRLGASALGADRKSDEALLPALSEAGVPLDRRVFGIGHYLPPPMVQFIACSDVLLQDYQSTQTPFWQHHPVGCTRLTMRGVQAVSLGPNNDGFDPESCSHVLVEGCRFDTGDDCIAIKSGKDLDTQYGPTEDIVIQDCVMQSGHGGLTLGSECAAGIRRVYARRLVMENASWRTNPLNIAIRLKTNMNRGGFLSDVHVRDISLPHGVSTKPELNHGLPGSRVPSGTLATSAGAIVTIDCAYDAPKDPVRTRPPMVSRVRISNVVAGDVDVGGARCSGWQAIVVLGPVAGDYNGAAPAPAILPVSDIEIRDCDFGTPKNSMRPIELYNVRGLRLMNVKIAGELRDETLSA